MTIARIRNHSLFNNSSLYLIGNILSALIAVVTTSLFTKILGPENFGKAGIFITASNFCLGLTSMGAFLQITTEVARGTKHHVRAFHSGALYGSLILTIVLVAIAIFFQKHEIVRATVPLDNILWLIPISSWLQLVIYMRQYTLIAYNRSFGFITYQICLPIAAVIIALSTTIITKKISWEDRVITLVIAQFLFAFLAIRAGFKENLLATATSIKQVWSAVKVTLPVGLYSLLALITANIDVYCLTQSTSPQTVGIYLVALQLSAVVDSTGCAFNRGFISKITSSWQQNGTLEDSWIFSAAQVTIATIVAGLIVSLFAPWLIRFLTTSDYVSAATIVPILSLKFVVLSIQSSLNSISLTIKKPWHLTLSALANLTSSILFIILIWKSATAIHYATAVATGSIVALMVSLALYYTLKPLHVLKTSHCHAAQ